MGGVPVHSQTWPRGSEKLEGGGCWPSGVLPGLGACVGVAFGLLRAGHLPPGDTVLRYPDPFSPF